MKIEKYLSMLIIIICTLSCSNDDSSNEDETTVTAKDIYVCGYEQKTEDGKLIATVWKNGVVTSLTDGTNSATAMDVIVAGEDVYVVGYEMDNNSKQAKVWKNGTPTNLTNNYVDSIAEKIIVSGSDVYIKGTVVENGRYQVKLWKNGVELYSPKADIYSFAVDKSDVYMVGREGGYAKVWKNGVGTNLTNGNAYSTGYNIEVKGNDVYVVGIESVGGVSVARLWKNGIASSLSDGKFNATASSISIVENDIYVSGSEENSKYTSKIWKNGEVIWAKENISTLDLEVVGQDYYLLSNTSGAKIYKNGLSGELSLALNSTAYALFITRN